jgi:phage terminase large subunit
VNAELPEKTQFLFERHRYKILYGGRGAAKSHSVAKALLIQAAQRRMRVLCARELQSSIQDSVHKLLKEQIEHMGLASHYVVQQSTIRGTNGSEFIFSGLKTNATKIKSTEGIDIVWVEEAERVSEESWSILIPTIRKAGSEIWATFNPQAESDPTYQRFIEHPPPGAAVVRIGWEDNPWFADTELVAEKDWLYSVDPEAAAHVWGGEPLKHGEAQILRGRWRVESFEPSPDWEGPYYGADWGFANDPTALVRIWIRRDPIDPENPKAVRAATLYIEHEVWGVGIDVDDTPAMFDRVPDSRKYVIRADSARPETISFMRRHGFPKIESAKKGPGSVEEGIAHLRGYKAIVIHPRCPHAAEEARLWSWKVDRLTGDVLPELVGKHDHIMDAVRYAVEPFARGHQNKVLRPFNLANAGQRVSPWEQ